MAKKMLERFRISGDVIDAVADSLEDTERFPSAEAYGRSEEAPLAAVAQYYERTLASSAEAKAFLEQEGLVDWRVLSRLGCGYSDGTLCASLSRSQREALSNAGVLLEDGREALAGSLVFPLKDGEGQVCGFYGCKADGGKDVHLPGTGEGLVNREAIPLWREEIILTKSVIDILRFLSLGIERVIPCHGTAGVTGAHLKAFRDASVKKIILGFNDPSLGERLKNEGFSVAVLPDDAPVSEAIRSGASREELELVIREAHIRVPSRLETLWQWNEKGSFWELWRDGRHYKAMGSTKRLGSSLRLSVRIEREGMRFLDHVDLYSARSRQSFREQSAAALGVEGALVEQDLLSLLDQLETIAEETDENGSDAPPLSAEDRENGLSLLESPTLFEDIIRDMEEIGHVGEDENKLLVYLAASSRKTASPVSVVVSSASAAGKSFLIDTVRRLMPSEDVINLTSLSDQALNYMGEGTLLHKLLILGEAVHNEVVEHQIREMLSSRCLSRMVVTKDERTGKLTSSLVKQDAIVSLMMSTTRVSMNAENASRYLLVHADESDEQTKRIHDKQNSAYSFDAMRRAAKTIPEIIRRHHAAQRLLERVTIVNPYAGEREFPYRLMRSRRDNKQLQDLVAAVCFLRQFQKERKNRDGIVFIECDRVDVDIAWGLFRNTVLKANLLELPESLVRLYEDIRVLCRLIADESGISILEATFDQRQLRRRVTYLGAESVKKYLRFLVSLDYIAVSGRTLRGKRSRYELIADESLESLAGFDELTGKSG